MWLKKLFEKSPDQKPSPAAPSSREELLKGVKRGRLVLPQGMKQVNDRLFENCDQLEEVVVPGTVKKIGVRAFAKCSRLKRITLEEGVEELQSNVFTDCSQLASLRLPESIRRIDGWTFYHSGLKEPVFSADGRTLVYYPQALNATEYSVPEGVETIGSRAFIHLKQLTRIHLPQSLKRIERLAFLECGFKEITIPPGAVVEGGAFYAFDPLPALHLSGMQTALEASMNRCRVCGLSFLAARRLPVPKTAHWKEESFRLLANRCAQGDVQAMEKMTAFFSDRAQEEPETLFYQCAEHFWRVRAWLKGSADAKAHLEQWAENHPDERMVSPGIDERLRGSADGDLLNALGFLFFEEEESYSLGGMDASGVVEVSRYSGEEGPDEDGFGREDLYDWWYLDGSLQRPEGVGMIHDYSNNDKRCNQEKFRRLHDQAAAAIKQNMR